MSFQPSVHSYGSEDYEGWFTNVFSKEGRADNKKKRAKKKRKKGDTLAAERLEGKADVLMAKVKGDKMLNPHNAKPGDLWSVKEPWATRARMTGAGLDGTARGYRPAATQKNPERRAVILGGILALSSAGIAPWDQIDIESLPQKVAQGGYDHKYILAVAQATGDKKVTSLRAAAEKMRKEVIKHKLSGAAWPARAMFMLTTSAKRAAVTKAAAGATAAGTGAAAGVVAAAGASPPWLQNIVTGPAAAILGIICAVSAGVGAGAEVEGVRATGDIEKYGQAFTAALDRAGYRVQAVNVQSTVALTTQKASYQTALAQKVGEVQGTNMTEAVKVLALSGGIGVAIVATSVLVRHIRSSE